MRRARSSPVACGLAAVVAGLLSGACATTRYTQSGFAAGPGAGQTPPGSTAALEVEGLRLRLATLDRAPRGKALPPLALRVAFEPRELGYSFDPGQVVLRGPDGQEWRPSGGQYVPLAPGDSFDLVFDAAVPAGATCELVIDGLARGPRPLPPVRLRLARREGRSIDKADLVETLLWPLGYMVGLGW